MSSSPLAAQPSAPFDPTHQEALLESCNSGDEQRVRALLADTSRPVSVHAQDSEGWTPLHWAVAHPSIVRLLLYEAAAPVDARDLAGKTTLHWACQEGQAEVARLLLAAGAAVNARDNDNWTPLAWAHGSTGTLQLMIDAGGEIDAVDRFGKTALHWAAQDGFVDSVELLVAAGSGALTQPDHDGLTPLHWACNAGRQAAVALLLRLLGSRQAVLQAVQQPDSQGQTPLTWAACLNHAGVLQLLLEACRPAGSGAAGTGSSGLPLQSLVSAAKIAGSLQHGQVFALLAVEVGRSDMQAVAGLMAAGPLAPSPALAIGALVGCCLTGEQQLVVQRRQLEQQARALEQREQQLAREKQGLQHLIVQAAIVVKQAQQLQQQQQLVNQQPQPQQLQLVNQPQLDCLKQPQPQQQQFG